jgi:cobalt-zinc-cadmium efflux system outer membrane protein
MMYAFAPRAALLCLQKPTATRFFTIAVFLGVAPLAAAEPLDVVSAQAMARKAWSQDELVSARAAAARADGEARTVWANPTLGWDREQTFGTGAGSEDGVHVAQSFDLSGRRGLWREAGERRAAASELAGQGATAELDGEVARRFYAVLAAQERAASLTSWAARLEAARAVTAARVEAGDAARWELLRMDRELRWARTAADVEGVRRDAAWTQLAALTGHAAGAAEWPRVQGTLLPEPPPEGAAADPIAARALAAEAQALDLEAQGAERGWVPGVEVGAGYKTEAASGARAHGYSVGLSLTLPLWDDGSAQADAFRAQIREREAERSLATRRAQASLDAARDEALGLHGLAEAVAARSAGASDALVTAAQAAYAGGELTLLELLDAERGVSEDELRALELAQLAREARIELDRLLGGASP